MGLSGFLRSGERCEGGLSSIWLAAACDIASCTYDETAGVYVSLTLRPGASFHRYEFREDSASYRQWAMGDYPCASVVHELSFSIARADAASVEALSALLSDDCGVVAILATACGETFIAGWSPEFEQECPLRQTLLEWDTRSEYCEDSECRIILQAEDISFSRPFNGVL